jgi:hypothetical protein
MGYDLHATRAKHWISSAGHEISAAEWLDVITWDPDLCLDKSHGTHAVFWIDREGGHRGWFDWCDGVVYTTDADEATVRKLLELATRMKARVQGDSDKFYESIEDWKSGHR